MNLKLLLIYKNLERNWELNIFFGKNTMNGPIPPSKYTHSGLRNKSTFNPKTSTQQFIDVFKSMVEEDLRKIPIKKDFKDKEIWEGIGAIENQKNIVICLAEIGGGIVALNKVDYDKETERILSNENTYKKLIENPTKSLKMTLQDLVNKANTDGIFNKVMSVLYQVPKIHKIAASQQTALKGCL